MALTICPECEKQISDKSDKCIHCGFPLIENISISSSEDQTAQTESAQKKRVNFSFKTLLIPIIALIVIGAVSVYFALFYIGGDNGKLALSNTQKIKDMLKDPNSLILYEDVLTIFYLTDDVDETGFYTYIDYGAANSYGGIVRETAMFKDYTYVGTISDEEDLKSKAISDLTKEEIETRLSLMKTHLPLLAWQIGSEDVSSYDWIDKNKIIRNLK